MVFPTSFVGTALFPQGLWEQEIGSLLAVPTNLWEQLFPQRLWEHQMEASYWLFTNLSEQTTIYNSALQMAILYEAISTRGITIGDATF